MEVTALCFTPLINVLLLLLPAQVQHCYSHRADATFPRVVPSRLQLFEHESVFINCEGFFNDLTKWRVMRKIKGSNTVCHPKSEITGPCNITTAFTLDSGEYWCEADGKKSNTVSITVAAGSVILESPALPVMEGDDVTLHCKNKRTSNLIAYFYKDGHHIGNSSAGQMIIHSVSTSDEGQYRCEISGVGKSAESRLTVTAVTLESPALPVMEGEAVTLRCQSKQTSSNIMAVFFKDGLPMRINSTGHMIIQSVSKSDEGLYKCKISAVGESAESWLAVTAGSVIVEIPALPVMEGESVTLRCRNKETSNLIADFFKDGRRIGNSSTRQIIIHSVSKYDEGQYKCKISGAGESAESQLTVRVQEENPPLNHMLLWIVGAVLLVGLLVLLVVGLRCMKHKVQPGASMLSPGQTVSAEASADDLHPPTYAVVTKPRKAKETSVAEQATYSLVTRPRKEETSVAEQATYSLVTRPRKTKDEEESLTTAVYSTLSMDNTRQTIKSGPRVFSSAGTPVLSANIHPQQL